MGKSKKRSIGQTRTNSAAASQAKLPKSLQAVKVTAKKVQSFRKELFRILRMPKEAIPFKLGALKTLFAQRKPDLARALRDNKLSARDFGCKDLDDLMNKLVILLTARRVRAKTLRGFLRSIKRGYKHNINGEVFEWLVINLDALRADLTIWARYQVEHLNELGKDAATLSDAALDRTKIRLIDGTGDSVRLTGEFGKTLLATEIWIVRADKKRVKFVDFMYITEEVANKNPTGRISPAVQGEIKLPAAARAGPEQMAEAIPRFSKADSIEMVVNGVKRILNPSAIVFSTFSVPQSLIKSKKTAYGNVGMSRPQKSYGALTETPLKTTEKGIGATYLDVAVDVGVSRVTAVTNFLFMSP